MNDRLNILLISPNAPPKNTAESIQVRRILAELDKHASGQLVTVTSTGSWGKADPSLALPLQHFDTELLDLPFHLFTGRLLMSRHFAQLHMPDALFWITYRAKYIIRRLKKQPDIIYSRSSPMSAALLAYKLKQKLGVQWIMHLSDPWADNPYKKFDPRDEKAEATCFTHADLITLTTQGQATHYQKKYPSFAKKIFVSPNVMDEENHPSKRFSDGQLHIVFAGSLYGDRSPEPFLKALDILRNTQPELFKKLRVDFYGNAQEAALKLLKDASDVVLYHGAVSFAEAYAAQASADIVLNIEAELNDPLGNCFLPSKVIDCLALGRPILAITPAGSETTAICEEGYGWAVPPSQPNELASQIAKLVEMLPELRDAPAKAAPKRYSAKTVTDDLLSHMNRLQREHRL